MAIIPLPQKIYESANPLVPPALENDKKQTIIDSEFIIFYPPIPP